ncbi:MAG: cell surface protein SprA [Flavobacteriales bacterium]|nr:MAG: cell surface protein SprA [Flavobacteriales bacterium]
MLFILALGFCGLLNAQEVENDSGEEGIEVKEDYSLPNPTSYEGVYDVETEMYYVYPKIGNLVVGEPIVMTVAEYQLFRMKQSARDYYREKSKAYSALFAKDKSKRKDKGLIQTINVRNKIFEAIFGGNTIEIIPNGYASFDVGGLYQKIDNPLVLPQNRTSFNFDIEQRIQLGLLGKVGENLRLKANYDTQSGFSFENRMNIAWEAKGTWKDLQQKGLNANKSDPEDKIVKKVEFGNINMPLSTSLIRGSESLMGLKTEFQLGKTKGTMVLSQQQGEARNIVIQGGGVMNSFKVNAVDYQDNQHYFLGHYFLNNYDNALLNYPQINSKININRLEVWVLDQGNSNLAYQKSIIGIRDLGEGTTGFPSNNQNNLYQSINGLGTPLRDATTTYNTINGQSFPNANGVNETYVDGEQFIFNRKAKRLASNEYSFDSRLGYISLNQKLNDNQLLAVAYSYTVNGSSTVYKVGEFSEESPVLITKLLKPNTNVKTTSPMWDLMMKNIYSLDAYEVERDGFILNVYYRDPQTGGKVNYLPNTPVQETNLLKLLNWDRLNMNGDLQTNGGATGDGVFDFVEGITVRAQQGVVIFTKVQPFGSYMASVLGTNDPQYVYTDLYTQQKQVAEQSNLSQRYTIEGRYKGSQGEGISLGAINIPEGSVKVTANGVQLQEGIDYTVDYVLGQVKIINEQIKASGQTINVSLENQMNFNTQRKRYLGLNLERQVNDHLMLAGTVVNYSEVPLTQKVNFGQESVNNTMFGVNLMYNNEVPFLTRLTDNLPLIKTEAPSNVDFKMEAAYLMPGLNSAADNQSYVDDFEQTTSKISLKEPMAWSLASKPEKNQNNPVFAGAGQNDDINNGDGRGLLSWYNIDPRFWKVGGNQPNGIDTQSVSNHASRRVKMTEIYNNRDLVAGNEVYTNTLDITYYPEERGPYNFNQNTELPQNRWAGMMRPINVSNFTNSNIEYVEFWLMDPYADDNNIGDNAKILLQLGNVSEDVLKDGKMQYENGLSTPSNPSNTTTSNLGVQPEQPPVLYAFATEGEERKLQDVGYDGLSSAQEQAKFGTNFTNPVTNTVDPASDDFLFYLSDQFQGNLASSIPQRYRYFRNPEGNSKSNSLEVASQTPDVEDANRDFNLDQSESYNQYEISLNPNDLQLGLNFISDVKTVRAKFQNGSEDDVKWYLFRIPVSDFVAHAGTADVSVLNNVRFARLLLTGFEETATLRFGSFDLVRSEWRRYAKNIFPTGVTEGTQLIDNSNLEVGSVNLEENGLNQPPYVLPPGIERQVLSGNAGVQRQNEASLYMKVTNFGSAGSESRGVFKKIPLDIRRFKNLKLFVHAQNLIDKYSTALDENTKFFIRFGNDATDNYYEYEASLKYTSKDATSAADIWPSENEVNLPLENFVDLKLRRDNGASANILQRYTDGEYGDTNKKIYVKGRPSLGNVETVVIGLRSTGGNVRSKNIVLWVNEIRLSGVENKGGYAGNANLNFNLGDFATVNTNGAYSSVGFGNINSRPAERAQSSQSSFSITTAVNVGKLLPEKTGVKIPVNYSYTQTIEDPKYNPLDTDVEFEKSNNKEELKKIARTLTRQRSLGIVNMRKERTNRKRKSKFYDVENLSLTMVYNDDYFRDIYTKRNLRQYLRGNLDYNYSFKPWVIRPFYTLLKKKTKATPYLKWLKEFNFNPIPTKVSFRAELDRNYNELEFRNIDAILSGNQGSDFDVIRNNNFYFGWQYNLGFSLSKSLKMQVSSATRTLNDEIDVNTMNTQSIFKNVFQVGRPVLYNHKVNLNYKLPFKHFPFINFISAELGYGFTYNWNARSTVLLDSPDGDLGNVGQNTNTLTATGTVDFEKWFQKLNYLKKVKVKMAKRKKELDSLNAVYTKAWKKKRYRYKKYKFKTKLSVLDRLAYALTSVKNLNFDYTENSGTMLPGLLSKPNFFGYGTGIGGPTYGFLLGSQDDVRRRVIENGWISSSEYLSDAYVQTSTKNLNANLQIQPMRDLRIDLNLMQNYTTNLTQAGYNVDINPNTPYFDFAFENEFTTYSNSAIMVSTAFGGGDIYRKMVENTKQISQQMGGTVDANGYTEGHSVANAYVLIPAFRSAVEGRNVGQLKNAKKAKFPFPNWRVVYSGLKNIPMISGQFTKVDITHGYNATYTMAGIQSSIDYYNTPNAKDVNGDFYNPFTFAQVGYVESFSPLIGLNLTMRNNLQFKAQYNKNRTYMLGLVNHSLTEDESSEYVVGFGYLFKNFRLGRYRRRRSLPEGMQEGLNVRADFSLRDNKTKISNILLDNSQVTGGQRILNIKLSADYNLNKNLNLRFFYNQMMSKYKISTAFPLSTIRAGISATFTFDEGGF